VGRVLAQRTERQFVDLDELIVARCGETIPEIFEHHGEEGFRAREADVLGQALTSDASSVIATGGGVVERIDNRHALRRSSWVVWLDVAPSVAFDRVGADPGRPLLGPDDSSARTRLSELARARRLLYRLTAHQTVRADRSVDEIAERVQQGTVPIRAVALSAVAAVVVMASLVLATIR